MRDLQAVKFSTFIPTFHQCNAFSTKEQQFNIMIFMMS